MKNENPSNSIVVDQYCGCVVLGGFDWVGCTQGVAVTIWKVKCSCFYCVKNGWALLEEFHH